MVHIQEAVIDLIGRHGETCTQGLFKLIEEVIAQAITISFFFKKKNESGSISHNALVSDVHFECYVKSSQSHGHSQNPLPQMCNRNCFPPTSNIFGVLHFRFVLVQTQEYSTSKDASVRARRSTAL